jgi:molecular chaperone GrpE
MIDEPVGTASAEEVAELPDRVSQLPDRVAELQAEVAELEDRWRRAVADFDNFRKRVARESAQQRDIERARIAAEWLPVLDNLDLALAHAGENPTTVIEGIRAVREQALELLDKLGFPRQAADGEPFDPTRHEAVAVAAEPDVPAGTVLQVVRPGYGTGERQLRPASVIVAKGR